MSQKIRILRQTKFFWIIFLLGFTLFARAQFAENVFADYPTGLVFSLHKGDKALWIGSENGLLAVSGHYVKKFDYSNSPFFGVDIKDILQDSNGNVWIATFGKGVFVITDYAGENAKIELVVDIDKKYCRNLVTQNTNIYVSCQSDIYVKSSISSKFVKFFDGSDYDIKDITNLSISEQQVYFVDSKKRLLTIENGLFSEIDLQGNNYSNSSVDSLIIDSKSQVWIGTDVGILKITANTSIFYPTDQSLGAVSYIFEKAVGDIWFFQDTFMKLAPQSDGSVEFSPIQAFNNFQKQDIYDLVLLDDRQFIFSSPLSGISTYSDLNSHVSILDSKRLKKSSIQFSFYSKTRGVLLGIDGNIYHYDPLSVTYTLLIADLGFVNSIYELDAGRLIISSDNSGIFIVKFNQANGEIQKKTIFKPADGYVSDLTIRDTDLYFGVVGGKEAGVYLSKDFTTPVLIRSGIHVDHIIQTHDSSIYFELRFIGLVNLDNLSVKDLTNIGIRSENSYVKNCLKQSSKGVLLICSDGGGLGVVNLATSSIEFLNSSLTGGSLYIRDLVEDSDGNFWVTTNQGLVWLDLDNKVAIKLGKEVGIIDDDFEITASINLANNEILIAGDNLNYVIDSQVANQLIDIRTKQVTTALLTRLDISEREKQGRQERSTRLYTSQKTDQPLVIRYDEYLFSITLAANNFIDRNILGFEYRLLGLDTSWFSTSSNESTATYSTLPAGDYTFQVRVKDPKSYVDQPINSLKIRVLPPFWQTWQAYFLYVIVAISLLFLFLKYRTLKLRRVNKQLKVAVLDRTNELAMSESRIKELLKQKESLFAHASHEIRTPLSLILGPLQRLGVTLHDQNQLKQFELISRNTKRLTVLVDQILELEKLDSAKTSQLRNYAIEKSLVSLVASFQPIAELKLQQLTVLELQQGVVRLTEDSFEKIISNLLINAVKYCPEGAKIEVSTSIKASKYIIKIADNGLGIAVEDQSRIFDRFMRTQNSSGSSGTGLGLAVVKELLIANGGSIELDSTVGHGTTFIIELPLLSENAVVELNIEYPLKDTANFANEVNEHRYNAVSKTTKEANEETILVIEDNPDMRLFLIDLLSDSYDCIEAIDGADGLDKAIEFLPNLIITDLMMPLADGFELTENIRSNELTAHIPIILLTAKGDDSSRMEGWKKTVDDYISKPFNNDELLLRVANLLSIRKIISRKFGITASAEDSSGLIRLSSSEYYSARDKKFFEKFVLIVEEHFHQESFNRSVASDLMCVSERQLNRKLNALIDYNFSDYLRKFRLDKAKNELEKGRQITEVAYTVGFSAPSYFSHCFKAEYELSPKAFVDNLKNR